MNRDYRKYKNKQIMKVLIAIIVLAIIASYARCSRYCNYPILKFDPEPTPVDEHDYICYKYQKCLQNAPVRECAYSAAYSLTQIRDTRAVVDPSKIYLAPGNTYTLFRGFNFDGDEVFANIAGRCIFEFQNETAHYQFLQIAARGIQCEAPAFWIIAADVKYLTFYNMQKNDYIKFDDKFD